MTTKADILFLTYTAGSVGPVIRSFELCRALNGLGLSVALIHINPKFRAPQAIIEMMRQSATETFHIEIPENSAQPSAARAASAPRRSRPSLSRKIKLWIKPLRSLLLLSREVHLIREWSPAVVMVRPDGALSYSISCKIAGIPYIEDPDGPIEELALHKQISSDFIIRYNTFRRKSAPAILSISRECTNLLTAKGIRPERLYVCPNSANTELFHPDAEKRKTTRLKLLGPTREGNTVVGFSGMQASWHGLHAFAERMCAFLESNPQVSFLIIGRNSLASSPAYEKVRPWIDSRRIIMTGQVAYGEMPEYLDAVDVVIMPYPASSLFYFSPMKMFEALALGKVIVAPAMGQMQRILSGMKSAFLYDIADVTNRSMLGQLAAAIQHNRTAHDPFVVRDRFLRNHTWTKSAQMAVKAGNDVLERAGSQRRLAPSRELDRPPIY